MDPSGMVQEEEDIETFKESHKDLINSGRYYDKNSTFYDKIVGDPCYRYNKEVKEKFF